MQQISQLVQGFQGCSVIHGRTGHLFSLTIVTGIGVGTSLERNHYKNEGMSDRNRTMSSPKVHDTLTSNDYEKKGIETKKSLLCSRGNQNGSTVRLLDNEMTDRTTLCLYCCILPSFGHWEAKDLLLGSRLPEHALNIARSSRCQGSRPIRARFVLGWYSERPAYNTTIADFSAFRTRGCDNTGVVGPPAGFNLKHIRAVAELLFLSPEVALTPKFSCINPDGT
ncbi:hypothetical protein J6590_050867 [Homalodisca vitripennis]|nr:hypothetical protein J6590_050867 [Homalodisca vitripennis]